MQAFELSWIRWLLAVGIIGAGLVLFLFLGFYLPSLPGYPTERYTKSEKWPAGIEETPRGIPAVLIMIYIIMTLFIFGYSLYVSLAPVTY